MNTEIRKAKESDIEELKQIARRTIDNYRSFLGNESVDWFLGSGASDQYVDENVTDCWVISVDGEVVGFQYAKEISLI